MKRNCTIYVCSKNKGADQLRGYVKDTCFSSRSSYKILERTISNQLSLFHRIGDNRIRLHVMILNQKIVINSVFGCDCRSGNNTESNYVLFLNDSSFAIVEYNDVFDSYLTRLSLTN